MNIFAHTWELADSYGRLAIETADAIERVCGVQVNRVGEHKLNKPIKPMFGGVLTAYPTQFWKYGPLSEFGTRVALTMFESDALPMDWIDPLNGCDTVIVPSKWLVDVFKSSGVTKPVYAESIGVSSAFRYVKRKSSPVFKFLAIGDHAGRKGVHDVLFEFVRAFGDRDDVHLFIKTRHATMAGFMNKNITLINEELNDADMARLYWECDCMVFPTKGEGFGLPPREFAATGGIALVTNWGGTADDIERWGIPLPYTLESAWAGGKFEGIGRWAQVDRVHLRTLMQWVAAMPYAARMALGAAYAENVAEMYTWDRFGKRVYEIWSEANANSHTVRAGA